MPKGWEKCSSKVTIPTLDLEWPEVHGGVKATFDRCMITIPENQD